MLCLFCFLPSVSAGLLSECANDPIKTELPCSGLATTRKKLLHPSSSLLSGHGLIKARAFLAQSLLKGPSPSIDGLLGQPQGIGRERSDPERELFHKRANLRTRERPIHPSIALRLFGIEVLRTEDNFEGACATK